MNKNEKEMYDIMKNPEKYKKDIQFKKIYRNENNYVFAEFSELEYRGIRITFILNEKKELQTVTYISEGIFLDIFTTDKSLHFKEILENLWQDYIKKYNLLIKLAMA